jgi:hypothetical protein
MIQTKRNIRIICVMRIQVRIDEVLHDPRLVEVVRHFANSLQVLAKEHTRFLERESHNHIGKFQVIQMKSAIFRNSRLGRSN